MEEKLANVSALDLNNGTNSTLKIYQHDSLSADRLFYIAALADHYYTPLLCLVGVIGNCLSLAVFCFNPNQRNLSSSYYLSALAISDTGFLITVFIYWVEITLGPGVLVSRLGCPLASFSGQVTCFLSVWFTVAFTVERFFAVCSPLQRSSVCTVSKARKVIASLTVFALIAFSYVLVIAQVVEMRHVPPSGSESAISTAHPFDSTDTNLQEQYSWDQMDATGGDKDYKMCTNYDRNCEEEEHHYLQINKSGLEKLDSTSFDTRPSRMRSFMFNSTSPINLNVTNNGEKEEFGPELRCTVPLKLITVSTIANYLDSVITLIIPFILIFYFNLRIAICVWKLKDERRRILAGSLHHKLNAARSQPHQHSRGLRGYLLGRASRKENSFQEAYELYPTGRAENQSQMCGQDRIGSPGMVVSVDHNNLQINPNPNPSLSMHSPTTGNEITPASKSSLGQPPSDTLSYADGPHSSKQLQPSQEPCCAMHSTSLLNNCPKLSPNLINGGGLLNAQGTRCVRNRWKLRVPGRGRSTKNNVLTTQVPSTSSHSSETRVTKMLLLVSTAFLLLNLPSHAIRLVVFFQSILGGGDVEVLKLLAAAEKLSNILLFNTNFAVNFFLYCLSGRNFRKSLWSILFGKCHKKPRRSPKSLANNVPTKKGEMGLKNVPVKTQNPACEGNPTLWERKRQGDNALQDLETIEMETSVE